MSSTVAYIFFRRHDLRLELAIYVYLVFREGTYYGCYMYGTMPTARAPGSRGDVQRARPSVASCGIFSYMISLTRCTHTRNHGVAYANSLACPRNYAPNGD